MGVRNHIRSSTTACALLLLACSGGEQHPQAKAKASAPPKAAAPRATSQTHGTALAAAGDATPRLFGLSDDENLGDDFRANVVKAMTIALGRPPATRQDALNATYRAVGWQEGTMPTDQNGRDAYHQACRWGFTLGKFVTLGRDGPFRPEELAPAPLDEHAHRAFTKGWTPEHADLKLARGWESTSDSVRYAPARVEERTPVRRPEVSRGEHRAPSLWAAREERRMAEASPAVQELRQPLSELENLNVRLEQLAMSARKIEGQIAWLEAAAREPNVEPRRLKRLQRKLENMRDLLRFTEASAQRLEKELDELRSGL